LHPGFGIAEDGAVMRNARRAGFDQLLVRSCLALIAMLALGAASARAASLEELVSAVVRLKTYINPDGQTVQSLGRSGDVQVNDPVLIASGGGPDMIGAARVSAKREFAGSWEYLLDEAIFTKPPHPAWSGAALISREGKLLGVGSLIVGDTGGDGGGTPGNMFVPIERLPPILGDLIADGRVSGTGRPWLGVAADDMRGHLVVSRVTPGSPGEQAGIRRGDEIVGVAGEAPRSLADFYRKIWATGAAGATVPLDVQRGGDKRRVDVKSINRLDNLKLKSTL
jgi:S1-C subfamily serine protease